MGCEVDGSPANVFCRWCGTKKGYVLHGATGQSMFVLFCPCCDWARGDVADAGPPPSVEQRIRDAAPKP